MVAGAAAGVCGKDVDNLSRKPKAVLMRWLLMAWNGATLHAVFTKMDNDGCAFPMPCAYRFVGVPSSWVARKRQGWRGSEWLRRSVGRRDVRCERCMQ